MKHWILLIAIAGTLAAETKPEYEVYAIRYATTAWQSRRTHGGIDPRKAIRYILSATRGVL